MKFKIEFEADTEYDRVDDIRALLQALSRFGTQAGQEKTVNIDLETFKTDAESSPVRGAHWTDPYDLPVALGAYQPQDPSTGMHEHDKSFLETPAAPTATVSSVDKLPPLSDEQREATWANFVDFCGAWSTGFEEEQAEQPDRVELMRALGTGLFAYTTLVLAFELGSLQKLVHKAMIRRDSGAMARIAMSQEEWVQFIARLTGSMVAVSHQGFPDLSGTYDYSTKWMRSLDT